MNEVKVQPPIRRMHSPFSRWADVHHKRDLAAAVVAVLWMIFLLWIYPVLR